MNNTLSKILIFIGGAMVGSAVTYKIVSSRYDKIVQEEIDSVKESYASIYEKRKRLDELETIDEDEEDCCDAPDEYYEDSSSEDEEMDDYEDIVKSEGYDGHEEDYYEQEVRDDMVKPYVIHPDEFGDMDYYEKAFFTLYADGIVDDDFGDIVDEDDIESLLGGRENLEQMGGYEKDLLYIRNENNETDYEITRDVRRFSEI